MSFDVVLVFVVNFTTSPPHPQLKEQGFEPEDVEHIHTPAHLAIVESLVHCERKERRVGAVGIEVQEGEAFVVTVEIDVKQGKVVHRFLSSRAVLL